MASRGLISSGQIDGRYTARLYWKLVSQSVANNTSTVRFWSVVENTGTTYDWNGTLSNWRLTVDGVLRTRGTTNSNSDSGWTWPSGWTDSETGFVISTNRTECIPEPVMYEQFVIPHNSDGTCTVYVSHSYDLPSGGAGPGSVSLSGNITLNTIPRTSVLNSFTAPSNLKGDTSNSIALSITRYSTSFTHDIKLTVGSAIIQWYNQSVPTSLSLTSDNVNSILAEMETTTSATATLTVTTKLSSTTIGAVSKTSTIRVDASEVPTCPNLSFSEAETAVSSVVGLNDYINGISKIKIDTDDSALAPEGTSLASLELTYQGIVQNFSPYSGLPTSYTTSTINWSGTPPTSQEITVKVIDKRGRSSISTPVQLTALAYASPIINSFIAQRSSTVETTLQVTRSAIASYLNGENTLTLKLYTSLSGEDNWSNKDTWIATENSISESTLEYSGYFTTSAYDVKLVATDLFSEISQILTVSTGEAVMCWGEKSVAIGKMVESAYESSRTLDLLGNAYIDGDITVTGSLDAQDLSTNMKETLVDLIYPIGSIYITVSDTNPSILFPGTTWSAYAAGRVLVGQDTTDSNFDTLEETGGSANAVVVSHSHRQKMNRDDNGLGTHTWHTGVPDDGVSKYGAFPYDVVATTSTRSYVYTETVGESGTDKNLQPYIVVKMWKRIS
jgi:hypothetical protein